MRPYALTRPVGQNLGLPTVLRPGLTIHMNDTPTSLHCNLQSPISVALAVCKCYTDRGGKILNETSVAARHRLSPLARERESFTGNAMN